MNHDSYSDDYLIGIFSEARVFAIVGASTDISRPSNFVMSYLMGKGYEAVPVNPMYAGQPINGRPTIARLDEVSGPVDVVDIFRNSTAALEVVREAIRLKDQLAIKTVWMQIGVVNREAAGEAEAAGLNVVMNRCPKVEYGRLSAEIAAVRSRAAPTAI